MWSTCTPRLMQIWRSYLKHSLLNTSGNNNPLVFLWPGCFYTKGKHAASLKSCRSQRDPKKTQKRHLLLSFKEQPSFHTPFQVDGLLRISHFQSQDLLKVIFCISWVSAYKHLLVCCCDAASSRSGRTDFLSWEGPKWLRALWMKALWDHTLRWRV